VIKTQTQTERGELVTDQFVTEFFRGVAAETSIGERPPNHRFVVDGDPVAQIEHRIAEDQTTRYAAASGDDFAIHLDDEFARAAGLPRRIIHGLCTLAHAGRAVLEAAAVDDVHEVRRLAVRFSAPLFPGETLTTRVWRVDGGYTFDALTGDGRSVLKDGRAEVA
jgi:acyl dehydratase